MEVYLDNSATTKPYKEVVDEMVLALSQEFYNPSAAYRKGFEVEKKIKSIRKNIANSLAVEDKNIIFTSGGTESNNAIIRSICKSNKKLNHIITSEIEHPAVLNTVRDLEGMGYELTILKVDEKGLISLDDLKNSIKDTTALVSIMYVNNEIGSVQDISSISKVIRERNEQTVFHIDAVQAYGKINFKIKDLDVDFMSVSSHKIHGPKGIGFMYVKDINRFNPLLTGGGQESNLRSGTENVPGIYGMGKAIELLFKDIDSTIKKIEANKLYLCDLIKANVKNIRLNSDIENGVCHILNITFEGVKGEVLLHFLEEDGICVSTGSACSAKKKGSHVLNAIGLKEDQVDGAIRFSLSEDNTREELDYVVDRLKNHVESIRLLSKMKRR